MFFDFKSEYKWAKHFFSNASLKKVKALIKIKKDPIFIAGCGRSGTSILLSIISAHPNIYGIKEETNIYGYEPKFNKLNWNKANNKRKLIPFLLEDDKILTAQRWCEKTPRNIRNIDQINREFNNKVKIIHIIRDGRDVITSKHPLTGGYHVTIDRWVNDVKKGLKHRKCSNVHEVRYEDLILNFKETLNLLLGFLEEDYTDLIGEFHKHTNVKKHKAFNGMKAIPISSKSIGKWRNEEHSKIISEFYSNTEAVQLLKELGYEI